MVRLLSTSGNATSAAASTTTTYSPPRQAGGGNSDVRVHVFFNHHGKIVESNISSIAGSAAASGTTVKSASLQVLRGF